MRVPRATRAGVQLLVAALCVIPLGILATDNLPDPQLIRDGGIMREFDIARDELHPLNSLTAAAIRKITPLDSAEQVRRYGGWLRETTGQEMELVLYERGRQRNEWSRRLLTRQVVVKLRDRAEVERIKASLGTVLAPLFQELPDWFVCTAQEVGGSLVLAGRLRGHPAVLYAQAQLAKMTQKKLIPNDPFFSPQWHLHNVGQNGGTAGIDINVTTTWNTYRGVGVVIGIVDDGLQYTHPDLAANYSAALSYDFNFNDPDPAPSPASDTHGTAVAGLAGARGNNGIGVSGVAPEAGLAGLRLLGAYETDAQDAAAALYRNDAIWVKNNSWGGADGTGELQGAGPLLADALATGAVTGRGGKGTIYVFAGGNGLASGDNVNYDGYANSLYAVAVSAVTDQGQQASYSEPGACLVVAAPSGSGPSFCSGGRQHITTTDLTGTDGYNNGTSSCELPDADYTQQFGGTSAATPIVSGVIALMLQANPSLCYRDVAEVLMRSATKVSPSDSDWWTNSAGVPHNHKFGAGLVNAGAAVILATNWMSLDPVQSLHATETNLSIAIPDNNPLGITRTFTISNAGFRVERVALTVTAPHQRYGDLAITLVSPSGTQSRLAENHTSSEPGYEGWTLTTVRHWGEVAKGTWTVHIADLAPSKTGTLEALDVLIQGSSPGACLSAMSWNGAQYLTLRAAAPGWNYLLETSPDLQNWVPLGMLRLDLRGRAVFVDVNLADRAQFYRARLLQ